MRLINRYLPIIVVFVLSYWTIAPLFHSGFFQFHDNAQVQRVYEMKTALRDGMLPVRWVSDLGFGYGYPIFTFYAPFIYYVGSLFNLIGFDSLIATKIMIGLGMLVAGVSMYLLAREFWGRLGALISAALYLYAPYHALNLYVRGALSELWAYGLLPFVFFGVYNIYKTLTQHKEKRSINRKSLWLWSAFTSLSYAALITTHNLTAMMVTPFLLLESVLLFKMLPKQTYRWESLLFFSLVIGIILAAFYWLPALTEMNYTNVKSIIGGGSDYKDHFVCLSQLWNSPWGYGGSAPGCLLDGLSFRIGKVHILLALLSLIPLFFTWRKYKKVSVAIIFAIIGAIGSIFLLLDYSKFIWDSIPQMAFFQFPWRFLVLASFFISFLGGAVFILLPKKLRIVLVMLMLLVIIFVNAKLFIPEKEINYSAEHYTNKSFLNWQTSNISYEYMPQSFAIPKKQQDVAQSKLTFLSPGAKLLSSHTKTQEFTATVKSSQPTSVNLAIAYFPAWQIYLDNTQIPFTQYDRGLKMKIPSGTHTIHALYKQTTIELIADIVSLTGVLIIFIGIIAFRKVKN